MKNPYKHLREKAGYTQKKFCDEFDFAKQTLLSIEQGVYEEISDRMYRAIVDAALIAGIEIVQELSDVYNNLSLFKAYSDWRVEERKKVSPEILRYEPVDSFNSFSPMYWFVHRTTGSVQGFAKQLKVQTATILSYTTGKQKDMPYPLREALADAGYPYIDVLEKMQNDWNKNRAE